MAQIAAVWWWKDPETKGWSEGGVSERESLSQAHAHARSTRLSAQLQIVQRALRPFGIFHAFKLQPSFSSSTKRLCGTPDVRLLQPRVLQFSQWNRSGSSCRFPVPAEKQCGGAAAEHQD
ncbi:hypothetical protein SRHO_G00001550 [Serrasalmus rhombeus]